MFFNEDDFSIKKPTKVDMPLKKNETKLTSFRVLLLYIYI